jgi:hypothetical protein
MSEKWPCEVRITFKDATNTKWLPCRIIETTTSVLADASTELVLAVAGDHYLMSMLVGHAPARKLALRHYNSRRGFFESGIQWLDAELPPSDSSTACRIRVGVKGT